MTEHVCDSTEALAALAYLRSAFGGFGIGDAEERVHLRLFRTCTTAELRQAIDELVQVAERRPSPNEVGQRVRMIRRQRARQPAEHEPWPEVSPAEVARHIEECREILRAKGARA